MLRPCRITLLSRIPLDLKTLINYYHRSIMDLSILSPSKEELEYLVSIRKEIVISKFTDWNTCTTDIWYLPPPFFGKPSSSCISRIWYSCNGYTGDDTEYQGEEIIKIDELIKCCLVSNISFTFPDIMLNSSSVLLDIRSMCEILKKRYSSIGGEFSEQWARGSMRKFLSDIEKYTREKSGYNYLINKYLCSCAMNLGIDCKDILYQSVDAWLKLLRQNVKIL